MQEFQLIGDYIAENLVLEHLLLDHCAGYIAPRQEVSGWSSNTDTE